MGYKHTYDTIYTHFQGITNNNYGFGRPFLLLNLCTRPPIFLPVHIRFYPSKCRMDGSQHKAMFQEDTFNQSCPLEIIDRIIQGMENFVTPLNIYLDLSKAFDTIETIIYALMYYNIKAPAHNCCENYLSNRK